MNTHLLMPSSRVDRCDSIAPLWLAEVNETPFRTCGTLNFEKPNELDDRPPESRSFDIGKIPALHFARFEAHHFSRLLRNAPAHTSISSATPNIHMDNETKSRIFALKTSHTWMLPASEEPEVVDKLRLALKDYAILVGKVFRKEHEVDWVVM